MSSGTPASNFGLADEGEAGGGGGDAFHGDGFVAGFDLELQIAVGAPPQRAEDAARSAIEDELVVVADEFLAVDFVAIALLARRRFEERLGVAHADDGALAARYGEPGIGRGQIALIEEHGGLGVGGCWRGCPCAR